MAKHEAWWSHPYREIDLPICRNCGRVLDIDTLLDEPCPIAALVARARQRGHDVVVTDDPLELYRKLVKP